VSYPTCMTRTCVHWLLESSQNHNPPVSDQKVTQDTQNMIPDLNSKLDRIYSMLEQQAAELKQLNELVAQALSVPTKGGE
jgi:hypothetical protein